MWSGWRCLFLWLLKALHLQDHVFRAKCYFAFVKRGWGRPIWWSQRLCQPMFSSWNNCKRYVSLCCRTPFNNSRSYRNGLFFTRSHSTSICMARYQRCNGNGFRTISNLWSRVCFITRNKSLTDCLPDITMTAAKLESIFADIRKYTGAGTLVISHGLMYSRTAEGFYKTLVWWSELPFWIFWWRTEDLFFHQIKINTLGTRMIEGFFGHITKTIQGNNLTFGSFSNRVATEAFHFIIPVVTSVQTTPRTLVWEEHEMKSLQGTHIQLRQITTDLEYGRNVVNVDVWTTPWTLFHVRTLQEGQKTTSKSGWRPFKRVFNGLQENLHEQEGLLPRIFEHDGEVGRWNKWTESRVESDLYGNQV